MKQLFLMMALWVAMWIPAVDAHDLTIKSGKEYHNISIGRITAGGIQIQHDRGVVLVPFDDLPDSFFSGLTHEQKKQVEGAREWQVQKRIAQKAKFQCDEEERMLKGIQFQPDGRIVIFQVLKNGVMARYVYTEIGSETLYRGGRVVGVRTGDAYEVTDPEPILITDIDTKGLVDGMEVPTNERDNERANKKISKDIPGYLDAEAALALSYARHREEEWRAAGCKVLRLYLIGTFQYKTTIGALKTIKKYTYSREKAIQYLKRESGLQK